MALSLLETFSKVSVLRVEGRTDYPLIEIIFLCISAVISGCDGWESIEEFVQVKLTWLRKFLPYQKGIPTHDIIARVRECHSYSVERWLLTTRLSGNKAYVIHRR